MLVRFIFPVKARSFAEAVTLAAMLFLFPAIFPLMLMRFGNDANCAWLAGGTKRSKSFLRILLCKILRSKEKRLGSVISNKVPLALIFEPDKPLNCKYGKYNLFKFPRNSVLTFKVWFTNCAFGKEVFNEGNSKYKSLKAMMELFSVAEINEFCGVLVIAAVLS